eukprot:gi/632961246/ref/XP_007896649.1/ PREDICTED: neuroblast differentiation-associated protein AHNAK-like [Callorhinchus milii]
MSLIMNSDTEVIRPGKGEPLSSMLTLADADDGGVIIRDIKQDSDIAKASTLKKGDHIYGATIYFDNMNSGDVAQILKYSESCKAGLKLHSDGEITSPDSLKLRNFSLKSLDAGIGDQTYTDIYNKKIKKHLKLPTPNINAQNADPKAMKLQDPDIRGPSFGIPSLKEKGVDAEFKTPNVEMPSLNLRGPNISGPDGDLGFKVPNIKGVSPKLDGNFKSPTIDVKSPEVDLNVPDTNLTFWDKLKFPKFKKPNLGISEPDVKMPGLRLDTDLPETNIKLPSGKIKEDMKFPKVDVKTPGLDVKAPKVDLNDLEVNVPKPKIKTSTFKLPSLNIKPSKPDVNLKTPKVTGDVDLPKFSIKSPNVDVNKPNIDLHGPSSKMKMPNIGLPSFNTPDLNMKKPDLDLDGKLKMPNFKMKKGLNIPDVDIQGSKGDLGINVPDVNLQSKKFKMPTFNAPGRDLSVPDIDVNLKKPDITDNVNISFPKTKGEFQVPGIDVKKPSFEVNDPNINLHGPNVTLPNVDFDDRKAKIKSLGIKLPSFTPNTKGIDLTAPKLETDFKGPKLDIESPDLDINTPKPGDIALGGNFNIPKFTTPKYSLSGQKGNLPDVDLPGVNIKGDVKPKGIDMKSPKGDIDINMPGAEFKTPNVEMPSFNLRGPNISGPDGDLGFKVPNIKGVSPKLDGNFKSPTIDVKSPEVDLNVPDTNLTFWDKLKFPKFKKPNLGISEPDVKMPGLRLDTDLPETNIKLPSGKMKLPKVDAKIPKLDLKAPNLDIKAPKLDMKTPELDLKTPKLDVKTPKLDMDVNVPKIKTPTLKIPSLNLPGINTSKPDVNLSAPDLKAGFSGPQIDGDGLFQDINLSNAEGKFKIPDVSSPSLSIPDYKAKMPEINADLKSPKIDITPKGNLEGKSQKFKNLFKWSLPKASVPDVNMDLNKPDVNGQLSLPDPKFQGAIKGPNIDLEGKKFDMKAPSAEFQGPKFETPEMNLSPLKASLPDLNLPSLENARSNIKGLKIDGDLSNPKVKGSDFYVNLPKAGITMPDVDINMKAPKISGRDEELDLKSPQVKGNIDLPEPSIKGGVKLPTFNANVPGAGVDVKSSDLKFNDPSLSRISGGTFKVRSASVSDLDEPTNGSTNGLNLKAQSSSTLNINGDTKSKKSRFKLPSLGYKSRGSVDLNKAQVESSKSFGSRFNLPELEFSLTPTS